MKKINFYNFFILIIISLLLAIFFVGPINFWFSSTNWLYGSGDLSNAQLGWKFFKDDAWRFPIGKNPNYGLELSNSIVFTDSIPLFAIIFKFLNSLGSRDFQYISLWIFLNFFLQTLFTFLIIHKSTKDNYFSLLASVLLLLSPFMLFRMSHHFSLGAHWLILASFYIFYFARDNQKEKYWFIIIFLSILIHLYFTLILLIIYMSFVFEKALKYNQFKNAILNIFIKAIMCLLVMYCIGYFESSPVNAVSTGYGVKKLDLLGFFDPKPEGVKTWSMLLPDIKTGSIEGFNYLGFGSICLVLLSLFLAVVKGETNKSEVQNFKFLRSGNIYLPIFFLWAITTNISFMGNSILSIPLPKYVFGLLSIFSSTGRFAWPIIYFVIFFSIIFTFRNFSRKIAYSIILAVLLIQIVDVSKGLKNYSFNKIIKVEKEYDPIWVFIEDNYKKIRTTYHFNNYGPIFLKFSKILSSINNIETDIILNAAMDRQKSAKERYDLTTNIFNKTMPKDTAYIIDNIGHLIHLKQIFKNENYGFFFRDGLMVMLPNHKDLMTKNDIDYFKNINPVKIDINKKYNLYFKDELLGFGWSHNFGKKGVWSEGENSFIFLSLPENIKNNLNFNLDFEAYNNNNNLNYGIKIYFNEILQKELNLNKSKNMKKINFDFEKNKLQSNILKIRLEFSGLQSPYDNLKSPDARKLGILLKDFKISEKL